MREYILLIKILEKYSDLIVKFDHLCPREILSHARSELFYYISLRITYIRIVFERHEQTWRAGFANIDTSISLRRAVNNLSLTEVHPVLFYHTQLKSALVRLIFSRLQLLFRELSLRTLPK